MIRKSLLGNHEVNDDDLRADFRHIMRVGELGGHVQIEIHGVDQHVLAHFQVSCSPLLVRLFQKDWSEGHIYLLLQVLYQNGSSELNAIL